MRVTKNIFTLLFLVCLSACNNFFKDDEVIMPYDLTEKEFTYQNPIVNGIDENGLRDCQILKDDDYWYLTGTSYPYWNYQESDGNLNKGVVLYKSSDLNNWEFVKYIIEADDASKWYYKRFWAPEIHKIKGKYYATFNCRNDNVGYTGQHLGYAVANHIEGPYKIMTDKKPLARGNDLTFFEDKDGKVWAFWNKGRDFGIGYAEIDLSSATLLTTPKTALKAGKVDFEYDEKDNIVKELNADGRFIPKVSRYYEWDSVGVQGASILENNGIYYLFYSSWTRGCEIGYATATKIEGPWVKNTTNPFYGAQNEYVCQKNGIPFSGDKSSPFNQVGHNQIFKGPDNRFWLSSHGISPEINDGSPFLVLDPIWFNHLGKVKSDGPTYTFQKVRLNY